MTHSRCSTHIGGSCWKSIANLGYVLYLSAFWHAFPALLSPMGRADTDQSWEYHSKLQETPSDAEASASVGNSTSRGRDVQEARVGDTWSLACLVCCPWPQGPHRPWGQIPGGSERRRHQLLAGVGGVPTPLIKAPLPSRAPTPSSAQPHTQVFNHCSDHRKYFCMTPC